jgi:hypothetical protein
MKLTSFWVWGKHFMVLVVMALLFTMGTPKSIANEIRVDNDVGIEQADNTMVLDVTSIDLKFAKEYQEVGIVPALNISYVSSNTIYKIVKNETLQGSLYEKEKSLLTNIEKSYNQMFYATNRYDKANYSYRGPCDNNSHFRLDRSRYLIYTGNIA